MIDLRAQSRYFELFIQGLIFYSIGMHFIEIEFIGSHRSTGFFLWSERLVAAIFTMEYLVRWISSRRIWYPLTFMALVDLLAVLPFYIGFFVDLRSLRLIRTLRLLRLLKLYRHSKALRSMKNAFWRIRYELSIIGFVASMVAWCGALAIFELERERQPEAFGKMSDALWYVLTTVTTVGFGDKIPVTPAGRFVSVCTMVAGLALFGTFVSLIGSAFVEEMRLNRINPTKDSSDSTNLPTQLELLLQRMTKENFNPHAVLRAIEQGSFDDTRKVRTGESVRLLAIACENLANGVGPIAASRQEQ